MTNDDVLESHRPALKKLALDIQGLRKELLTGFGSRREVLEWSQRLTVRTLGEIRTSWYLELARQFRGVPSSGDERALLSALLTPAARSRELDPETADALRERLAAVLLGPSEHRAFRRLRRDATEYVDERGAGDTSGHDPLKQRYIAMRPALDELDAYQGRVLAQCVDGLEDQSTILEWGDDLELATHGELDDDFLERCYREPSTVTMLTSSSDDQKRARELFAATYLVPAYNAGVRDLTGRAKELPDAERATKEVHLA
ncbi:hypothetical protein [Halomontanus rarus]|uniref:hypothetical protein n=1 Tax=Halomontanus rarus TaxID=3034020 RepID=UPI0023E84DB5|nr:hypothetical protein [Halovivax sp. TS33]